MSNLLLFPSLFERPEPVAPAGPVIPDAEARAEALDTAQSFIVEAPAGSGKTALLIQRFLKLLVLVDDPAQVLAITFTRKATAEMLDRVLAQLASAAAGAPPEDALDRMTRPFALAVLERSAAKGWNLLDSPARLRIRTMDSVSAEIASALPVLSGSGGAIAPSEDADLLHAEAARRTLMLLGGADEALNAALSTLLLHRDGNLVQCEALIASMLGTREQWGELVPLSRSELDDRFLEDTILPRLDRALDLAICRALTRLSRALPRAVLDELCALAADMGDAEGYNGNPSPIALCAGHATPPEEKATHLEHWQALIHLLLTQAGEFRKARGITSKNVSFEIAKEHRQALGEIIEFIREDEPLRELLCATRTLPPARYPRDSWPVTKALFHVLSRALAELQFVFAARSQCDFAELGLLARTALRADAALDDLAVASGHTLQHLLVDEMQDTSTAQYEFLQLLTQSFDGHQQTVFLVGDPKQSIYLFRQARVERFVRTLASGLLGDVPVQTLRLTANFRSQPTLVQAFNHDFSHIFPAEPDPAEPELVPFQAAIPVRAQSSPAERIWHTSAPSRADAVYQSTLDAEEIRELILHYRAQSPRPSIAVLVRNRTHLPLIVAALRQAPAIPFRAVDIDPLAERPEILDLLALTRALLHPVDRTGWLALLRSPACGLTLADLHRLTGADDSTQAQRTVPHLIHAALDPPADRLPSAALSQDALARLRAFWPILSHSLVEHPTLTLAQSVSRTWRSLGFPSLYTAEALADAETFFQLLDRLEVAGESALAQLQGKVDRLFAASSSDPDAIDLMTIHKAKGLEWNIVIVPALHAVSRNAQSTLLNFLETNPEDLNDDDVAAGILAPISAKGRTVSQLNAWMRSVASTREAAERKRLFYVACTRAKDELHLFAAPNPSKKGGINPVRDSLLRAAWPAARHLFADPPAVLIEMPAIRPGRDLAIAAVAETPTVGRIPVLPDAPPAPAPGLQPAHHPRPEANFPARVFGNTLHAFLEQLSLRLASRSAAAVLAEVPGWQPRVAAILRASGLDPADIPRFADATLRALSRTLRDPEGFWLLSPHPSAASELSLSTKTESIRLDRTFLAGPTPLSQGTSHLWIVDYKTASHGAGNLQPFLHKQRELHAPQLEAYAARLAHPGPIRLALYHPALPALTWWDPST